MLLPFPAPSERRGVGEAGPSRCTEETPSRGRTGPAAGAQGPARGWPEHGAEVGPAGPSSLTPGDPRFEAGNGCSGPGRLAFSLTGSKWRRLLQRLLLCEGNNTPPRRQRRRRRRLRLAEHLPSGWACRRSVYPGQGALREEGQRQGAHPPESLLCDWGVAGGSSRSAEPRLRGRREGSPGPQPGAPRRSRPLRPPGPGPAFRGAGAARGTSGRPVSADRPPLLGSGGGRAAACLGHGEEGAPRGRGWLGARARAADRWPGGGGGAPGSAPRGRAPLS
ncbi:translation initiation factor IF-2-like [Acinonyx jubatus]|uniref:Translation initiation factor IF-2-like n=1 Tax=Acinonyx jubatus TaxID=32536 RepID=A0ABM3NGU1_ACIJB|nr:translation initiation factor IF-2-like [Acinonyx jubatus]